MKKNLKGDEILKKIDTYVNSDVNHIDALMQYVSDNDLELEMVASIVKNSPTLKRKIREDAEKLKMVEPAK